MNLFDQLAAASKPSRAQRCVNAAGVEKRKETLRRKRIAKWFGIFNQFPDLLATSNQLFEVSGVSTRMGLYHSLRELDAEGLVKRHSTVPTRGSGRDMIVWQWLGDK